MLKVFEWQLDQIAAAFFASTTRQLVGSLRDVFPDEASVYDDDALTEMVVRGRAAAESYGMSRGCDVERYLYLMFLLGEHFDTEVDWARETFAREDYTGQVRMDVAWAIYEGRDDAPAGVPFLP